MCPIAWHLSLSMVFALGMDLLPDELQDLLLRRLQSLACLPLKPEPAQEAERSLRNPVAIKPVDMLVAQGPLQFEARTDVSVREPLVPAVANALVPALTRLTRLTSLNLRAYV